MAKEGNEADSSAIVNLFQKEDEDKDFDLGSEIPTSVTSRVSLHSTVCQGLTSKIRDFHKFAKVDVELNKELEQWNQILKNDPLKLCMTTISAADFLKVATTIMLRMPVRIEHERITLLSEDANKEKPSKISNNLFIGGALAASSYCTLRHLGISHILCLCSNVIGQSDSQRPELFEYMNIFIRDEEDENIHSIFSEAHDFIDHVEQTGGKILVHCFEGKSRSATVVIAYLMIRKKMTLLEAWNSVKRVHRRAQPNDGFARILLELDQELHGKVSMEWQRRRKLTMKVCPICGKNVGLSSSSLKIHLQKVHKML